MRTSGRKLLAAFSLTLCLCASGKAVWAQEGGELDPIQDVAGLLVPGEAGSSEGVLYTTYSEEAEVLSHLGAIPIGPDRYQTNITGVPIQFYILRVILPGYWLPAGDLICQNGLVKVYRNSTCVATITGTFVPCSPYLNGNYSTLSYNVTKKCKKGVGFCVEVRQVLSTRNIYFDNQCTQLLGSQYSFDFLCN